MAYKKVRQTEPGIWLLDNGKWLVDIRPDGTDGKRHRSTHPTKAESVRCKTQLLNQAHIGQAWAKPTVDKRCLSDLAASWYNKKGFSLQDGAARLSRMQHIINLMGNPLYKNFNQDSYIKFRNKRLRGGLTPGDKPVTPNTCNHDLAYLKAMFNVLARQPGSGITNPLSMIEKLPIDESDITFLDLDEIKLLVRELDDGKSSDGSLVTRICLSTGARWGEVVSLRRENIHNGGIQFSQTKSGHSRVVPIGPDLEKEIVTGRRRGKLFKDPYTGFTAALERALIILPKGQRTHVLRHSFAVHFMLRGISCLLFFIFREKCVCE